MGRLDEIEARLKAIGERTFKLEDGEVIRYWPNGSADTMLCYQKVPSPDLLARFRSESDADLFINTPTDLAYLLRIARAAEMLAASRPAPSNTGELCYFCERPHFAHADDCDWRRLRAALAGAAEGGEGSA